jgi:microcystin-dependent protein
MRPSTLVNYFNENYISLGDIANPTTNNPQITIGNKFYDQGTGSGLPPIITVKGVFASEVGVNTGSVVTTLGVTAPILTTSTITAPFPGTSPITVIPGMRMSTLGVGQTITCGGILNVAGQTNVGTNLVVTGAATVGTNLTVLNNANITNTLTATNVNLTNINGVPYSPAGSGVPSGSLMMWPGGSGLTGPTNVPPGYLYCDGSTYSVGAPYVALYAAIGNTWGGTPGVSFRVPDSRGRAAFGSVVDSSSGSAFQYSPTVTFQSVTVAGAPVADTNNGWYVTATTSQVYVGMTFNFAGATGVRTITKILSNNGVGDGWTVPFVVLWSSTGTANTFPVFVSNSVANLATESTTTIAPFIGRQPSDPGATYNLQAAMGTPGNGQAIDQTSRHLHTYNLGNGRSYNVAGAPDLIADNNGKDTSMPQGLYSYTIPGGAAVSVNHIMLNNPANFGVFYYIKI